MAFWNKKQPVVEERVLTWEELLLSANTGDSGITLKEAMTIPAFAAATHLISNTIASLPIKLYKEVNGKVEPIEDDNRVTLLNAETGDTLNSFEFKKAMVMDYLTLGGGYAYVNKTRNKVKSIHYIDKTSVSVQKNFDPIFKRNDILVNGQMYRDYEFIKLLRNTRDGGTGVGVLSENNKLLSVAYHTLVFEEMLVKTGGNKKGFLKSQGRLSKEAITELKSAWSNLYRNNDEGNVIVLNNGLEFQESNNSSVEMQINQNKITNNNAIYDLFSIPSELMNGKATGGSEEMYDSFIKLAILPLLESFEIALNSVMLLNAEKGSLFFSFVTDDLLKGDIEKRFKAYEIAVKNSILQVDEIRKIEHYEPLGLDFIKLSLADVLYNPKTKEIYTPNMDTKTDVGKGNPTDDESKLKGGDK